MNIVERLEELIDRHRTADDIGDLFVIPGGRGAIVTYEGKAAFRARRLNECRKWIEADGLQVRAAESLQSAHLQVIQPE
jgi:hypothetical protein